MTTTSIAPRAAPPTPAPPAVDAPAPGLRTFPFALERSRSPLLLALLAYLFLQASAIDEEWPSIGAWRPRLVLGALLLLAALARLLDPKERAARPLADRKPGLRLFAFLVLGALSAVLAFDPALAAAAQTEHTVRAVGFFLVLGVVRTRRDACLAVVALVAGAGFYLLRSATEYLAGKVQFTMGVRRMLGAGTSYADPNSFAATIVLAFPLVLWAAMHGRSRILRLGALGFGFLGAGCVVLTHSRSGLVLLVLAALWAVASLRGGLARFATVAVLAGFAVTAAGGLTTNEANRFLGLLSPEETFTRDESAHGRIEGYEVSWRMFEEHPMLGVGPGCWAAYRQQRIDGNKHDPHNLLGQLLATRGILGALAFAGYVAACVALGVRERRRRKGATDPFDRAAKGLASALLVTFLLLFVSGLAAHNLDRPAWYLLPALLLALVSAPAPTAVEGSPA